MKIKRNNVIIADQETVLEQWKTDFSGLHSQCNENNEFDEAFYQNIMTIAHERERDMENDENNEINNALIRNEVVAIPNKLKYKKACGIDGIPNEILKLPGIVNILTSFLTLCFQSNLILSLWVKSNTIALLITLSHFEKSYHIPKFQLHNSILRAHPHRILL